MDYTNSHPYSWTDLAPIALSCGTLEGHAAELRFCNSRLAGAYRNGMNTSARQRFPARGGLLMSCARGSDAPVK
jgi:hypothetical protein